MNRVNNKLNHQIRKAISFAIEAIDDIEDIHYTLDWSDYPNSLRLSCFLNVDVKEQQLDQQEIQDKDHTLAPNGNLYPVQFKKIQQCLLKQGIKFNNFRNNLIFYSAADKSRL